jgi:predicted transcriptional regulator
MRVLLSIRPEYVEKILDGSKTYEFRRRVFGRSDVTTVIVYATRPVAKIVGEFEIAEILSDSPTELWDRTGTGSGITRRYFNTYFEGCSRAYALAIGSVREYDIWISPKEVRSQFTPPQSYMYVRDGIGTDWLNTG